MQPEEEKDVALRNIRRRDNLQVIITIPRIMPTARAGSFKTIADAEQMSSPVFEFTTISGNVEALHDL